MSGAIRDHKIRPDSFVFGSVSIRFMDFGERFGLKVHKLRLSQHVFLCRIKRRRSNRGLQSRTGEKSEETNEEEAFLGSLDDFLSRAQFFGVEGLFAQILQCPRDGKKHFSQRFKHLVPWSLR